MKKQFTEEKPDGYTGLLLLRCERCARCGHIEVEWERQENTIDISEVTE